MNTAVFPMSKESEADFYRLHSQSNDHGWCFCSAWWVPTWEGFGERTAEQNRNLRQELFDKGQHDGFLLYVDNEPAGWCQCGPRDRLEKLVSQFDLEPDPGIWAVTCFFIAPDFRKKGLARKLLGEVLKLLKTKGVSVVQGYPKTGSGHDDMEVWTGPEKLYEEFGFVKIEKGDTRAVFEKVLTNIDPQKE